jgi:hypothetical protein
VEGLEVIGVKVEVEGSGVGSVTVSEVFTNVFGRFVLVISKLSTRMVLWLFWSIGPTVLEGICDVVLEPGGTKVDIGKLERIGEDREGEGIEAERGGEGEIGGREGEIGVGGHVAEGRSKEGESQDGGDPGSNSTVVPGSREEGSTSRCSMNVTWKELKHFPVETSHKRYAFELGAYPISMQGLEHWYIFGYLVWISAKARHPISRKWDKDSQRPNHNSYAVLWFKVGVVVKLVR